MKERGRLSKGDLIERLVALAKEHGTVGQAKWRKLTGLSDAEWKYYWPNYSVYASAAGLEPNQKTASYSDADLLEALVPLLRTLGRMPTTGEHQIYGRDNPGRPNESSYRRFGTWADVAARLKAHCEESQVTKNSPSSAWHRRETPSSEAGQARPGSRKVPFPDTFILNSTVLGRSTRSASRPSKVLALTRLTCKCRKRRNGYIR